MTIRIFALKGKLKGKILLVRFFFCQVYVLSKNKKNITIVHLKITAVKNCSTLDRCVIVMRDYQSRSCDSYKAINMAASKLCQGRSQSRVSLELIHILSLVSFIRVKDNLK